jgi:putative transcriptional regulator
METLFLPLFTASLEEFTTNAETAGVGYAVSVVNAKKYNGKEVMSYQVLMEIGLINGDKVNSYSTRTQFFYRITASYILLVRLTLQRMPCILIVKLTLQKELSMKNRVRELREQKGLTQEQLGEMVGTSRQAINAIETEKFEPSIWLAYDISQVFGCPIEEVFLFKKSPRKTRADSSRRNTNGNKEHSI